MCAFFYQLIRIEIPRSNLLRDFSMRDVDKHPHPYDNDSSKSSSETLLTPR